jgi:hypothetical protein
MPGDLASALRAALATGSPAQLAAAVEPWDARPLTAADAAGLVAVLAEQRDAAPLVADRDGDTLLYHLAALFQNDAEDAATRTLAARGVPELLRLFDAAAAVYDCQAEPLVLACKMFALYAHAAAVPHVAATARRFPDEHAWDEVFGLYAEENHPHGPAFARAFRGAPPDGFAAVLLLELANALAKRGRLADHPFDTPDGRARLEAWARDPDAGPAVRAEARWALQHARGPNG